MSNPASEKINYIDQKKEKSEERMAIFDSLTPALRDVANEKGLRHALEIRDRVKRDGEK